MHGYNQNILQIETYDNLTNKDEFMAAPSPGLFHLVVKGDPIYWHKHNENYLPPFGALIIR